MKLKLYDDVKDKRTTIFCDLFKIYGDWYMLAVTSLSKLYVTYKLRGKYGREVDEGLENCITGILRLGIT